MALCLLGLAVPSRRHLSDDERRARAEKMIFEVMGALGMEEDEDEDV